MGNVFESLSVCLYGVVTSSANSIIGTSELHQAKVCSRASPELFPFLRRKPDESFIAEQ